MKHSKSILERLYFVTDSDLKTRPSQLYHENSKMGAYRASFGLSRSFELQIAELQKKACGQSKAYPYCKQVGLAELDTPLPHLDLGAVLRKRRSSRAFRNATLPFQDLSTLLTLGGGVNGTLRLDQSSEMPLRTYPSPGALYPTETYFLNLNTENLDQGVYHFRNEKKYLEKIGDIPSVEELQAVFLGEKMIQLAQGIFVLTAILPRCEIKYGERAYRFVHLEAGHLAQNFVLLGQAMGYAVIPLGGYEDRAVERILEVDGLEEIVTYSLIIGKSNTGDDNE